MSTRFHLVLVLFSLWIASSYGSLTMQMLKDRHVIITAPQNVVVFMKSSDKIVVAWTLPQIYVPHDTSNEKFETLTDGDKIGVLEPLFSFEPHQIEKLKNESGDDVTPTAAAAAADKTTKPADVKTTAPVPAPTADKSSDKVSKSDDKSATDDTKKSAATTTTTAATTTPPSGLKIVVSGDASVVGGDTKSSSPTDPAKTDGAKDTSKAPILKRSINDVLCRALPDFANFTVGEKDPGVDDNGWAVSLLESDLDILVTNMSLFYMNKMHHVVKFEEGCVFKVVVSYTRLDSRNIEKDIILNPSEHLATIENLKPGVDYKIMVSAHFVSGHIMSAKSIYVTTLLTGATCRCDWHGTTNHTSDCESPSTTEQHCDCNSGHGGRFCEKCADGYFRDVIGHACKPCECGDHGDVQSSCRLVEGFMQCDKCAKGYTGNVCHKCDQGFFRLKEKCVECHCNNMTRPGSSLVCHPTTGSCFDCAYNTSGYYCERCLPGYVRSPKYTGGCHLLEDTLDTSPPVVHHHTSDSSGISTGKVGAIIVVVVLLVCTVVGVVIIYRVRANRQRRALWTVEMRPDSDDLDFNSVHNEDARMDEIDDMEFYDRQAGRNKTSGKYSKLNEEC